MWGTKKHEAWKAPGAYTFLVMRRKAVFSVNPSLSQIGFPHDWAHFLWAPCQYITHCVIKHFCSSFTNMPENMSHLIQSSWLKLVLFIPNRLKQTFFILFTNRSILLLGPSIICLFLSQAVTGSLWIVKLAKNLECQRERRALENWKRIFELNLS